MLKALKILKDIKINEDGLGLELHPNCVNDDIEFAIKELEEYEQKFRDKEFKYRTDCQNILSAGRVEADNMPDKLAELEKVILDYYLAKGYQVGVGGWKFKVNISTYFKDKEIQVMFKPNYSVNYENVFRISKETTKEMFDKAIEYFRSGK